MGERDVALADHVVEVILAAIEDVDVVLDDDRDRPIRMTLPDAAAPASVTLRRPRKVERTITLVIRTWRERPISRTELRLVGIDNVQFLRPAGLGVDIGAYEYGSGSGAAVVADAAT